jgi:hypothetical protein
MRQADPSDFGPPDIAGLFREPRSWAFATVVASFVFVRCLFLAFAQVTPVSAVLMT